MKYLVAICSALLLASSAYTQNLDSLASQSSKELTPQVSTDSLINASEEILTAMDTVYIREVVYDTIYMSTPNESVPIDAQNVVNTTNIKPRNKSVIKTVSGRLGHSGGFGAVSFKTSNFRDETVVMGGLRGGWIINRTLAIGFEGWGLIPTSKYSGISETGEAVLLGGYGGFFLEPIILSNQVVHLTFPVSAGSGWLGYHEDFDNEDFTNDDLIEGDILWYIEPGANLEVNIARNFRIALGLSKRFTQDLELIQTKSTDFNKINYYMTLKIGSF
ncbi:MAG: hypothetical protein RJQ09_11080 [Cyclobacteriaceae bacterium]